jgi:hypothetical protein
LEPPDVLACGLGCRECLGQTLPSEIEPVASAFELSAQSSLLIPFIADSQTGADTPSTAQPRARNIGVRKGCKCRIRGGLSEHDQGRLDEWLRRLTVSARPVAAVTL